MYELILLFLAILLTACIRAYLEVKESLAHSLRERECALGLWARVVYQSPKVLQKYKEQLNFYELNNRKFDRQFLEGFFGTEKQAHLMLEMIKRCVNLIGESTKPDEFSSSINLDG